MKKRRIPDDAPEPDWDFLDWAMDAEKQWRRELGEGVPKTERGWIAVFPEARAIMLRRAAELRQELFVLKNTVARKVLFIKRRVRKRDRWFWKECLKYVMPEPHRIWEISRELKGSFVPSLARTETSYRRFAEKIRDAKERRIEEVAAPFLKNVRRYGERVTALCPFHGERTPSFYLFLAKNDFHCFGCGAHGDVIEFVRKIRVCSFREAVEYLADW